MTIADSSEKPSEEDLAKRFGYEEDYYSGEDTLILKNIRMMIVMIMIMMMIMMMIMIMMVMMKRFGYKEDYYSGGAALQNLMSVFTS